VLPEEVVSQLLNRSTAIIFQSVGFSGASVGVQESMRKLIEDCVTHLNTLWKRSRINVVV